PEGCCSTWLAIDFAVSTSLESEVMPVLAACKTCTPLPMLSSRLLMSLARESRPAAVKKLVGLSSAVLTFLPVARRLWVVASRSAVFCRESRFWRTAAERVMLDKDMERPFWRYATLRPSWPTTGTLGILWSTKTESSPEMPPFPAGYEKLW